MSQNALQKKYTWCIVRLVGVKSSQLLLDPVVFYQPTRVVFWFFQRFLAPDKRTYSNVQRSIRTDDSRLALWLLSGFYKILWCLRRVDPLIGNTCRLCVCRVTRNGVLALISFPTCLGRWKLGHGLGSFWNGVLCKLSREHQSHSCLDLSWR